MTNQDKNELLDAIFGDEGLAQARNATLLRGLKEMRRRRRRVAAARVSFMVLPAFLLALIVFYPRAQPIHQTTAPKTTALVSKVEYITAEQLFALFPNRSMALVGKPGHQQLIVLDENARK